MKSTPTARSQKKLKMDDEENYLLHKTKFVTWKKKMVNAGLFGYLKIFALSKKLDSINATMGLIALPLKVF